MINPKNGPTAIAKFILVEKYPIPSPRLDDGIMSAAIVPVAVVAIPNEKP